MIKWLQELYTGRSADVGHRRKRMEGNIPLETKGLDEDADIAQIISGLNNAQNSVIITKNDDGNLVFEGEEEDNKNEKINN